MSLSSLDFGRGAAQQEDNLRDFFYRSGAYQLAVSSEILLILGAKGAGKSAIYQRLKAEAGAIPTFKSPSSMVAEEPFVIRDLAPMLAEISQSRVNVWKLYFAALAAEQIVTGCSPGEAITEKCKRFLARWGLVNQVPTRWQELRSIKFDVGWDGFFKTEFPPKTKLTVGEIDAILLSVSQHFAKLGGNFWICLDSLDEVTLETTPPCSVEDILGDCMKAVGEIIRLPGLKVKLFFRSDIYIRLSYVNKDHFSSSKLELKWSMDDLIILLAHRLSPLYPSSNEHVTVATANTRINEVFDWGENVASFADLYLKLQDGRGHVLPRDLVHFCVQAKRQQETFNIQGTNQPTGRCLIGVRAINEALRETAEAKLNDFINVFKTHSAIIDQLRGHSSASITRTELAEVFGKTLLDASLIISDLASIGVLRIADNKAINQAQAFEIPFLYATALNLGI